MKFVIVNKNYITDQVRGGQQERQLLNDQAILRLNSKNEQYLKEFIKFSEDEIRALNLNTRLRIKNTYDTDESNIFRSTSEKKAGDYDSIVSHNFCDNTTWPSTDNSAYEIKPPSGSIWEVDRSEAQFSNDFVPDPTSEEEIHLEYYVWLPDGTEDLAVTKKFKNRRNLFEIGNEHFYSPPDNLTTLKFNQPVKLTLHGDKTVGKLSKMVIKTNADKEITGSYGTVSVVVVYE